MVTSACVVTVESMLSVRLPGAGRSDLVAGGVGASDADWRSADLAEGAVPEPDRLFWARLRLVLIKHRQMAIDSVVSFMQVVCSRVPNIGRFSESALRCKLPVYAIFAVVRKAHWRPVWAIWGSLGCQLSSHV